MCCKKYALANIGSLIARYLMFYTQSTAKDQIRAKQNILLPQIKIMIYYLQYSHLITNSLIIANFTLYSKQTKIPGQRPSLPWLKTLQFVQTRLWQILAYSIQVFHSPDVPVLGYIANHLRCHGINILLMQEKPGRHQLSLQYGHIYGSYTISAFIFVFS